jgi:ABC-2 type transport system ATP-binding protein
LDVIAKQRVRELIAQLNTKEGVTVFLTSHDAGDIEQVCRRAIVINHGEIILDAPVGKLKRDYLKAKTVDLLLEEPARSLLKIDERSGQQRLSIQLPGSIHEEIQDTEGIQVLKAKEHGLKLAIDTLCSPLEPMIAAIMQHCHILDMTISDPPMEEIIAAIYGQVERYEQEDVGTQLIAPIPSAPEAGTAGPGEIQGNVEAQCFASAGTPPENLPRAAVPYGEGK